MTTKRLRSIVLMASIISIVTAIGFMPIPYTIDKVGSAMDATEFVKVSGAYPSSGEIMVTSVESTNARVFSALLAFHPDYSLESISAYELPEDFDEKEYAENSSMSSSQINAILVAYKAANKMAKVQYEDAYVEAVSSESEFHSSLEKGDIITSVNNQAFNNPYDIMEFIQKQKEGEVLSLDFRRDGTLYTASAVLRRNKETGILDPGFRLNMFRTILVDPVASIQDNGVGGPSGGLMFSLEIYNQLTASDITKGKKIAGTGTVDRNGNVGMISGAGKKVIAADRAGAEIFFVPDTTVDAEIASLNADLETNYRDAVRSIVSIDSRMEVVPVRTFNDALLYLQSLPD